MKTDYKFDEISAGEKKVGVLVTPNISLFIALNAIEPLRTVNRLVGRIVYDIEFLSTDGEDVTASNGLIVPIAAALSQRKIYDIVFVGISYRQSSESNKEISKWLRFQASKGTTVAGLDIGVLVMASAGLLEGFKAAIFWELLPSAIEEFPDLDLTEELYCIDGKRITSGGATATLDMMLVFIHAQHGRELAIAVAHELAVTVARNGNEPQRMGLYAEPWAKHKKLAKAIEIMKDNLEAPLSIDDIATQSRITITQLRRLCTKHLEMSPVRFYLNLRLRKSRELVLYSMMHMTEIAQACGYSSSSTFARAFQAHFLISATEYRKRHQLNLSRPYIEPSGYDEIRDGLFPFNEGVRIPYRKNQ
ncbi:MAG: GlxA family transcriptional regulator [bacterium]|nr:GlxA family transcriptional regulator [bacterium]